jgi:hypothetical protein
MVVQHRVHMPAVQNYDARGELFAIETARVQVSEMSCDDEQSESTSQLVQGKQRRTSRKGMESGSERCFKISEPISSPTNKVIIEEMGVGGKEHTGSCRCRVRPIRSPIRSPMPSHALCSTYMSWTQRWFGLSLEVFLICPNASPWKLKCNFPPRGFPPGCDHETSLWT